MPEESNLFNNLITGAESEVEGHEEYLTQVVYSIFDKNPELALFSLEQLGVDFKSIDNLEIYEEKGYPVPGPENEIARIDLVIETDGDLIFVENKLDAKLNKYDIYLRDEEKEDQLQRYSRVLDEQSDTGKKSHLILIGKLPQIDHQLENFVGTRYWWDLYKQCEDYLDNQNDDGSTKWLLNEFLDALEIWDLDPPHRLTNDSGIDEDNLKRFLVELVQELEDVHNPKVSDSTSQLKFNKNGHRFGVTINNNREVEGFITKVGKLKNKKLSDDFWIKNFSEQLEEVRTEIDNIENWDRAANAEINEEEWIAQFENPDFVSELKEEIEENLMIKKKRRGDKSSITAEETIVFDNATSVRLAPYKTYERLVINLTPENIEKEITDLLNDNRVVSHSEEERKTSQYNLNIEKLERNQIPEIIELLQQLSEIDHH